jgi:hypothetical protein
MSPDPAFRTRGESSRLIRLSYGAEFVFPMYLFGSSMILGISSSLMYRLTNGSGSDFEKMNVAVPSPSFYGWDEYWPDYHPQHFAQALAWYEKQDQTLGG